LLISKVTGTSETSGLTSEKGDTVKREKPRCDKCNLVLVSDLYCKGFEINDQLQLDHQMVQLTVSTLSEGF
jgi:hypothetical protein